MTRNLAVFVIQRRPGHHTACVVEDNDCPTAWRQAMWRSDTTRDGRGAAAGVLAQQVARIVNGHSENDDAGTRPASSFAQA